MEKYRYVTQRRKDGPYEVGFVSAGSMREAERDLMVRNVPVLHIERVSGKSWGFGRFVKRQSVPMISLREKIAFSQNMEQCQEIDMGLLTALDICREMAYTKAFAGICRRMRDFVSDGKSLYDAMASTEVFEPLVLGLVQAGEKSGFLSKAFSQIKHNYRREAVIRRKVIKMMSYPVVVLFVALICVFFLMWKTVPTFVGLFSSAGMELPLPTRILMAVSHFTVNYPYLIFAGIVGVGIFVWKLSFIYRCFPQFHGLVLRLPIFGKLQRMMIQETFARTFLNLQRAGLRIIDSLGLCRSVSSCYPYKGALARAMLMVSSGSSLMSSLEGEKDIFGVIVLRTLGFGEKSGRIEAVLEPLSETLSAEIMDFIDNLNTVIEPLLTLLIGSVVLFILLSMFIPIFSLPKLI